MIRNAKIAGRLDLSGSGTPVANFTVASTPRFLDRQSGEWKDSESTFMRCNIWRQYAENVAETLIMWILKRKRAFELLFPVWTCH